jgi:signal transduction histidine kinase
MPRPYVRTTILYTTALIVGTTLAVTATLSGTRLDMFVAFAVLLVVGAALVAGMGPALVVAITSVIGDDVLLTGRLSGVEHWEHLIAFGGVAIAIGWLVGDRRRRQLEAEQAVRREQELREERASILAAMSHDVKSPLAVILGTAKQGLSVADPPRSNASSPASTPRDSKRIDSSKRSTISARSTARRWTFEWNAAICGRRSPRPSSSSRPCRRDTN